MFEAGDPGGSFPYIHTPYDTLATMGESAQHSVKFTQFALAYLGEPRRPAAGSRAVRRRCCRHSEPGAPCPSCWMTLGVRWRA